MAASTRGFSRMYLKSTEQRAKGTEQRAGSRGQRPEGIAHIPGVPKVSQFPCCRKQNSSWVLATLLHKCRFGIRPPPAGAGQVLAAIPDHSFAAVPKGVRGIVAALPVRREQGAKAGGVAGCWLPPYLTFHRSN
jgi:hypothetical protein